MKIQNSMDVSQKSKEYILVCFYILIEPATWITKKNQILWLRGDGGGGLRTSKKLWQDYCKSQTMLGIKIVHLIEMSFVLPPLGCKSQKLAANQAGSCRCLWVMYAVYWTILDNNRAAERTNFTFYWELGYHFCYRVRLKRFKFNI